MSSSHSVSVEGISKCFRINHADQRQGGYRTLRESLGQIALGPLRNLRMGAALGHVEDFWALRDVSFHVAQGEALGIVGSNGAGKSTLLKILTRITEPTAGRAVLRGCVGSLLEVGTGFHPELSGRENVFLNGSILGMTRKQIIARFDEIVAFSGVEKFIDTPIKRYSSGMKVRLAFSVAAHLDLEVLIIDEVLAVGDIEFQRKCLGRMEEVADEGRTVIFVSHNMNAVSQLCSRAILLENGQVASEGPVEEVTNTYIGRHRRQLETTSIADWPGHLKGRKRIVQSIDVNGDSLPGEIVMRSRSPLTLEIQCDSKDRSLKKVRYSLHFNTEDGQRILSLTSPYRSSTDGNVHGKATLTCHIDALPLIPGEYVVDVGCGAANGDSELFRGVGALHVIASPNPEEGNPDLKYKSHGYFFLDAHWPIEKDH